jgi:hypothetical protein
MDDVVKQRIKYLIEHGEVYPLKSECRAESRKIWLVIGALAVLQAIDTLMLFVR